MTKAEIVQAVYSKVGGFSKKEAADIVELVFETMKETLGRGDKIKISGFGNFVLRDKKQRQGRNPKTGSPLMLAERRVLTFKASQILKAILNNEELPISEVSSAQVQSSAQPRRASDPRSLESASRGSAQSTQSTPSSPRSLESASRGSASPPPPRSLESASRGSASPPPPRSSERPSSIPSSGVQPSAGRGSQAAPARVAAQAVHRVVRAAGSGGSGSNIANVSNGSHSSSVVKSTSPASAIGGAANAGHNETR